MAFLSAGSPAPDFTVNDQDGTAVALSDLKGKKVVLYFYPKDATPTCTTQACNIRDNYKALLQQGYEVFGVSTDTEKSHRKFIAKEKLPFRLLSDPERKMHDAYGTWIEKSMYGRQFMGTARITYIINEAGIITEVIEKVESKNHAAQIMGTLTTSTKKFVVMPVKQAGVKKIGKKTPDASTKTAKKAGKKTTAKKKK